MTLKEIAKQLTRIHAGCLVKCSLCEQTEQAILSALQSGRATSERREALTALSVGSATLIRRTAAVERDFDCILSDAIDELEELRALLGEPPEGTEPAAQPPSERERERAAQP